MLSITIVVTSMLASLGLSSAIPQPQVVDSIVNGTTPISAVAHSSGLPGSPKSLAAGRPDCYYHVKIYAGNRCNFAGDQCFSFNGARHLVSDSLEFEYVKIAFYASTNITVNRRTVVALVVRVLSMLTHVPASPAKGRLVCKYKSFLVIF